MVSLTIISCPLCGRPLMRTGNPPEQYRRKSGIHIHIAYYPSGFGANGGGYKERFTFREEVCQCDAKEVMRRLEDPIKWIQERDLNRK